MTNCISTVYVKNKTKLSRPIEPGVVSDETRQDNDVIDLTSVVYAKKRNLIVMIDQVGCSL